MISSRPTMIKVLRLEYRLIARSKRCLNTRSEEKGDVNIFCIILASKRVIISEQPVTKCRLNMPKF